MVLYVNVNAICYVFFSCVYFKTKLNFQKSTINNSIQHNSSILVGLWMQWMVFEIAITRGPGQADLIWGLIFNPSAETGLGLDN